MITIEVIQGPDKGRVFDVPEDGETIIGRESDALPLVDSTVSRRHSGLTRLDGHWEIDDLGSANGTFVNGLKIDKATRLYTGDQIRCGTSLLVFEGTPGTIPSLDVDEQGNLLDAAIVATVSSSDDSVVIPTPEAGAEAIGNLRILYGLTSDVSSIFNRQQLCQRTLDVIFDVIQADRAFLILFGPGGRLNVTAARSREGADDTDMPVSRTIINEVVSKQAGVLSSNAMRDKRFSAGQSVHNYGIRSAICVPIKGRESILGVIHVDASVSTHTYSTEQLRLLTALGNQTGMALENVRLHEAAVHSERLAAVGETVAALSHHIKNILQALGGGVDVVERALTRDDLEKALAAWPTVRRGLDRANGVILNMLAFSKPRTGLLEVETLNVNYVLNECVELMGPQVEESGAALITDLGDLPPMPADAGGLHQAFMNFLTNALDAVEGVDGGGAITVRSEFDPLTRSVVVEFIDNGKGMSPEEVGKIFEVFFTTKGHRGTGLGLAVANKVVREHRGKIAVESSPGNGTTFTITLPIQPGDVRDSGDTFTP